MKAKKNIIIVWIFISLSKPVFAIENTVEQANEVNLFELIGQGGWAMWPLGLCSLAMLFLIIYCFESTKNKRFVSLEQLRILENCKGDFYEALLLSIRNKDSVLSRTLLPIVENEKEIKVEQEVLENEFLDQLSAEENIIGTWINYLNVIATVSPMIGLLGTVSGMIGAFQTIGSGGMGRPELLAGDIGSALITTATGLIIGIPAMLFYFVLKARMTKQFIDVVQTANKSLRLMIDAR